MLCQKCGQDITAARLILGMDLAMRLHEQQCSQPSIVEKIKKLRELLSEPDWDFDEAVGRLQEIISLL